MTPELGPAVRRRQLGRQLRQFREAAGIKTVEEAGRLSGLSRATISRIENAKQTILPKNVTLLCQVYGVCSPMLDHLVRLAEASDERGWYTAYSDTVPDWFERYVGEESEATEVWNYEAEYVPGLLQTTAYVEAVTVASRPDINTDDLYQSIRFRQARQQRLEGDSPPTLAAVLNEAVIRRVVGSAELMRDQVQHLAEMARRPNVTLQVLPFSAGAHPCMTGSFTMLRFPDDDGMTTVFVEVGNGGLYPDRPTDLLRYAQNFQRLQKLALTPVETVSLLDRVVEEL